MKKIFSLINCFIISSFLASAQYTANLDYFAGTWKYENAGTGEEFILKLKMGNESGTGSYLVGAYSYKKNNIVVIDCLHHYYINYTDKFDYPVYATNQSHSQSLVNPNLLFMFFYDSLLNYHSTNSALSIENFIYTGSGPKKMEIYLRTADGVFANKLPPDKLTPPEYMVLTKEE